MVLEFSRRDLIKAAGGMSVAALLGIPETVGLDQAQAASIQKAVRFANWPLYLDYNKKTKSHPTLVDFTKRTGIPVSYLEVIDDNDTFTSKVTPQLRLMKDIGYDIVDLSDWTVSRWISAGFLAKFDNVKVPNKKNVHPFLLNRPEDPEGNYSLPWAGVVAGFAWNAKHNSKGIHTMEQLFAPANKGKIEVLSDMRDTAGLIMLWQGVDITKPFSQDKFMNAIDYLQKMVHDGFVRKVKGQSYQADLVNGDAVAVMGWSGDINQLNAQYSNRFGFAIPDSGGTFSTDNLMIPAHSPNKVNAEAVINYYYDPVVAARLANYINYICPVMGAQQAMAKINPGQVNNKLIFPDTATWKKMHVFRELSEAEQIVYSTAFQNASHKTLGS